jgi:two-component system, response regulator PdtaR
MNSAPSVLIVEDEAIVAADLERMLRHKGYHPVGIASSGAEAISLARHHKPDVILMDFRLEGSMNGVEAAREIQREHTAAIIYVTAMRNSVEPELRLGSRCVHKPYRTADLCAAIEDARREAP